MNSPIRPERLSNSALLLLIVAPVAIFNYLTFILNPANISNPTMYALQLIADIFSITAVSGLWVTMLLDLLTPDYQSESRTSGDHFLALHCPSVDVFIPVAREPLNVIEATVKAALAMDYPHQTFILDDGKSDDVRNLARRLGIHYVRRSINLHAKSGNINNGLKHSQAEFFAILDADFIAQPNFLSFLLGYMEDSRLAFVQSPQRYSNVDNFIASGAATAQEIFYRYVLPAKNSSESAFCVGTNVIFRRSAIDEIGGIFQVDHSEDIWTSLSLHEKGWKSLFVNKTLAIGLAPENFVAYFKQQKRWAQGGFSIFFRNNPMLSSLLSTDQKVQYMYSSVFYFIGFSILLYLVLPIIYLLFGISPVKTENSTEWLAHYVPYVVTFYALPLILVGKLRFSAISTSLASFYPYIQGFFESLSERRQQWTATQSRQTSESSGLLLFIWPHLLLISLSAISILLGWFDVKDPVNVAINSVWAAFNASMLVLFIINGVHSEKFFSITETAEETG